MIVCCPSCSPSDPKSVRSHGFFFRKSDQRKIKRFFCKTCQQTFSEASTEVCFGQKKRHLNSVIFQLYCSGVSLRRISRLLKCRLHTVTRKVSFLAVQASFELEKEATFAPEIKHIQFDDMESFEHSKCKPLSITLAVDASSRRVLGCAVSQIAAKGNLARMAVKKYGVRKSFRKQAREQLLQSLKPWVSQEALIETDKDPHYRPSVKKIFPQARHESYKGRRGCVVGQGELKSGGYDPLFSLNHTAAMFRANVNRLFRRTWNTTKKPEKLLEHLILYSLFHNRYLLDQAITKGLPFSHFFSTA